MKSLGKQLIVELYGCSTALLDSPDHSERILVEAVNRSGATVIQPFFHQFSPHGVSGVVVIAESHVAIHTWPEYGYCAVDIFTCGTAVVQRSDDTEEKIWSRLREFHDKVEPTLDFLEGQGIPVAVVPGNLPKFTEVAVRSSVLEAIDLVLVE